MKNASKYSFFDYIPFILSVSSIIFFFLINKLYPQNEITVAVMSLGIQTISLVVQGFINKQTILDTKDRLQELTSRPDLRVFGSMGDAEKEFASKLRQAKNIRNTFINVQSNRGTGTHASAVKNAYRIWFDNKLDGSWEDVAGLQERNDARFTEWKFPHGKISKSHRVHFIDCKTPFLNFCIIEYADKRREVMFGWLPDMNNQELAENKIFVSDDIDLIRTYEYLFERLKKSSHSEAVAIEH